MKISVVRCEAPGATEKPDIYIETESTMVPDWPSVREALIRQQPNIFDGYEDLPTDWATDPNPRAGVFVDTWLVTAKCDKSAANGRLHT